MSLFDTSHLFTASDMLLLYNLGLTGKFRIKSPSHKEILIDLSTNKFIEFGTLK